MTTPLGKIIADMIQSSGPMDLATYMTLCLTHPEHGYYTSQTQVFGRKGDFVTAPEISQLFGEMIGFWVADLWAQLNKPAPFILAELGGGKGTMMRDALRVLARIPGLVQGMRLCLVEISEARIAEQAAALNGYDVTWYAQLDELPNDVPIIIVNNEFFDVLPVRQVIGTAQGVDEVVVGLSQNGELQLGRVARVPSDLPLLSSPRRDDKDGEVVEFSPARDAVARAIYQRVRHQGGAMLTIDYGYDTPTGVSTIQAVQGHTRVDFLSAPGEVDLTALVDFARLKQLAVENDLQVAGPVGQGDFLLNLGITERAEKLRANASNDQVRDIRSALDRLTGADQMGSLFRVLCAYHDPAQQLHPAGFNP